MQIESEWTICRSQTGSERHTSNIPWWHQLLLERSFYFQDNEEKGCSDKRTIDNRDKVS